MGLGKKRKKKSKIERMAERKPRELTGSQMVERIRQANAKEQASDKDQRADDLIEELMRYQRARRAKRAARLRKLLKEADGPRQSEYMKKLEKHLPEGQ